MLAEFVKIDSNTDNTDNDNLLFQRRFFIEEKMIFAHFLLNLRGYYFSLIWGFFSHRNKN